MSRQALKLLEQIMRRQEVKSLELAEKQARLVAILLRQRRRPS
jgi:hypothetical protein